MTHLEFHSLGFGYDVRDYRDIMHRASKIERFNNLMVILLEDKVLIYDTLNEQLMEAVYK